jgi:hypothetical protein
MNCLAFIFPEQGHPKAQGLRLLCYTSKTPPHIKQGFTLCFQTPRHIRQIREMCCLMTGFPMELVHLFCLSQI